MSYRTLLKTSAMTAALTLGAGMAAQAQTIITTSNGIVRNSLCVGGDCQSGISFGDSTIIMKENNTRLKFADTSGGSFPSGDWEIEANSSTNGGQSYLGFNDCGTGSVNGGCATDLVFAVETGARSSALYVESDGDVGFGTSNPVVELHAVRGDTPTLRLEQDGSSGFTPQTWDMAGNESSFFIRDATGGSTLPFRVMTGGAPSQSLVVGTNGNVGIGAGTSPLDALEIERTGAGNAVALRLTNATGAWRLNHNGTSGRLNIARDGGTTPVKIDDEAAENLLLIGTVASGQVDITGDLIVSGNCEETDGACADYVFGPDHERLSLPDLRAFITENKHLPNVPSEADIKANGVNMAHFTGRLLEKIEELALYTLEQEDTISLLTTQLEQQGTEIDALKALVVVK